MELRDYILNKNAFRLNADIKNWKEALKTCTDLLHTANSTEELPCYKTLLQRTEEYGPYYVIAPGIAMPHGCSSVKTTRCSLVTLANPVPFGHQENDPVSIILCICAKSVHDLNEKIIPQAMALFDNKTLLKKLRTINTKAELSAIFEELTLLLESEL